MCKELSNDNRFAATRSGSLSIIVSKMRRRTKSGACEMVAEYFY